MHAFYTGGIASRSELFIRAHIHIIHSKITFPLTNPVTALVSGAPIKKTMSR